jgi:hypothetical protein
MKVWLCWLPAIDFGGSGHYELDEIFDSRDKADEWIRNQRWGYIEGREVK